MNLKVRAAQNREQAALMRAAAAEERAAVLAQRIADMNDSLLDIQKTLKEETDVHSGIWVMGAKYPEDTFGSALASVIHSNVRAMIRSARYNVEQQNRFNKLMNEQTEAYQKEERAYFDNTLVELLKVCPADVREMFRTLRADGRRIDEAAAAAVLLAEDS